MAQTFAIAQMTGFVNYRDKPYRTLTETPDVEELVRCMWYCPDMSQRKKDAFKYVLAAAQNNGSLEVAYYDCELGATLAESQFAQTGKSSLYRLYAREHSWTKLKTTYRLAAQGDKVLNLDIVNCHPAIAYDMHNDLTAIGRYVNDREKCLAEVMEHHNMSRDAAKDLFRKLLCQGSYDYDRAQGPCTILKDFWENAKEFGKRLCEAHPDLLEIIKKDDSKDRTYPEATLVSFVLQEKERPVVEALCAEFNDNVLSTLFDEVTVRPTVAVGPVVHPEKIGNDVRLATIIAGDIIRGLSVTSKGAYQPCRKLPFEQKDLFFNTGTVQNILGIFGALNSIKSDKKKGVTLAAQDYDASTWSKIGKLLSKDQVKALSDQDKTALLYCVKRLPSFYLMYYMNRYFAQCGTGYYVFKYDKDGTMSDAHCLNLNQFKAQLQQEVTVYDDDLKKHTIALSAFWLKGILHQTIQGADLFFPGEEVTPGFVNLYCGLPVTPIDVQLKDVLAGFNLIMNHKRDILCSGNADFFSYYQRWMGRLFQFKGCPVALVLYSEHQQVGKGIIFDKTTEGDGLLFRLLGHKYYYKPTRHLNDDEGLLGKFSYGHHGKLFIYCDEVHNFSGAIKDNNTFKRYLTSSTWTYGKKNCDPIPLKKRDAILITSNERSCARLEDGDARHAVIEVSNKYSKHFADHVVDGMTHQIRSAYFKSLGSAIANPLVLQKVLYYYQDVDINDFDVQNIPETSLREEMKALVESPVKGFVEEWQNGDLIEIFLNRGCVWKEKVLFSELWLIYTDYCIARRKSKKVEEGKFGRTLTSLTNPPNKLLAKGNNTSYPNKNKPYYKLLAPADVPELPPTTAHTIVDSDSSEVL